MTHVSDVLAFPPLSPQQSHEVLSHKLACYTDARDLAQDPARGVSALVVIDARAPEVWRAGHIPGAISFPHRTMNAESVRRLDRDKVYITYCDGIGCNGSTKAAWKLAGLGFQVKELIGGLDFWLRDKHPTVTGDLPGEWPAQAGGECGC